MKTILLIITGLAALALGVIGLIIPMIPGILFLLLAGLCFAYLSPSLRARMRQNPRMRRLFDRVDQGHHLPLIPRARLIFYAIIESAMPKRSR